MDASQSGKSRAHQGRHCLVACGLLGLALGGPADATAQSDALSQRLHRIAGTAVVENGAVGIVAAVVKGDETLLRKAYGTSDVEANVPMTTDTVIPIGSVTKQFTAVAVLRLRDEGKLSLDDDVQKWLPNFDTRGNKVTLRHLLGHTSGTTELGQMPELRAMNLMRNAALTLNDVYKVVSRQPFQFPTGSKQIYSNTNFWLLGLVIEKATGMTYEDYTEKKIFEPLGMSRSMYCNNSKDVPRRAYGYGVRSPTPRRVGDILHIGTYAAGAICSTAEDMITWLQALHGGRVLPSRSYTDLIAPSTLADGTPTRYALGISVGEDRNGLKYIGHSGGGFGFSSEVRWYPEAQVAIVVLTNSEPDAITATTEDLAAVVLPVPPPAAPFTADVSSLVGTYKGIGPGGDVTFDVTETPQGIAMSPRGAPATPLAWIEGLKFRGRGGTVLTFRRGAPNGPATELEVDTAGDHFTLVRQ